MAQEVILIDDLDGTRDDVKTVMLSWDGTTVELDLSAANRKTITEALSPYLAAGRKQRRPSVSKPVPRKERPSKTEQSHRAAVRKWATAHDIPVPARGPIPSDLAQRYAGATEQQ